MRKDPKMSRAEWGLLLILSVLWGGSFFFSKVAVSGLPPLTIVFLRFSAASVLVYAYLRVGGGTVPRHPAALVSFAGMGLLNNLVPAGLIVWGQTMIPSGLASALIATTPIFSILATRCTDTTEALTSGKVVGMVSGLLGTVTLLGVGSMGGTKSYATGIVACLGAAASYGCANAFGQRLRRLGIAPVVSAFGQMAATSVMALPLMLAFDAPWRHAIPGVQVWAAMAGLVVLSTALGYVIFFRILSGAGAMNVSLVTLLIPVSAILLGRGVLGETLSGAQLFGMLLIGAGLVAIDGRTWSALRRRLAVSRAS